MRRAFRFQVVAAALVAVLAAAPAADAKRGRGPAKINPVVFVHGGSGSGAQFQSQALRFSSNGYPRRYLRVLEYDSTFGRETIADVHTRLDTLIAKLQRSTSRRKVDVLGHSLGTTVMHQYLASAERAADVGHYVNIDGRTAGSPPGGVPTLALWAGRGTPGREIVGARNVTVPNQTHVEVATSGESFVEMYRFFTRRRPRRDIARERRITLAGRAQIFPQNVGVGDRTLQIWEVRARTGHRKDRRPVATLDIAEDGSWGPVRGLKAGRHYEFALVLPGATTHHIYYEPFQRSDHLLRLLTTNPGEGVNLLIERSDRHTHVTVVRYKEFWGDQGAQSDVLQINGQDVVTPATSPLQKPNFGGVIGMFAFDRGSDGVSNLTAPHPVFFSLPFLSGVDLFIPAADPPTGTVSVALRSRGAGPVRRVNFPNFRSTTDSVSVNLNDYESTGRRRR
jgi:pimeloyl-ACP methyl ester carboxylesterase